MINIKDLRGPKLKKDLVLRSVVKRWHNKNKSGGNFGINLYPFNEPNYEITGYHDLKGNVTSLRVGVLWQVGTQIFTKNTMDKWTYDKLISVIKKLIEKPNEPGWTQNIYNVEGMI